MTRARQKTDPDAEHSHRQSNLDTLARACPEWLLKADLSTRQSYSRSLSKAHKAGRAARQVMQRIEPLERFAISLLSEKLIQRFRVSVDVTQVQLDHYTWYLSAQIGSPSNLQRVSRLWQQGSLLHMALQNFTAAQADAVESAPGSKVHLAQVQISAIAASDFIALCREVDIGRRYQEHLASVLAPGQPGSTWTGEPSASVLSTLASTKAANLELSAQVAFMRGYISWSAYQMLLAVSNGEQSVPYDLQPLECCQLVLHGHVLEGVLVFRQAQSLYPYPVSRKRVLYVPQGAAGELHEYADLPFMVTALSRQLIYTTFRQALLRHAPLTEQAVLNNKLESGIDGHVREQPLSGKLFEQLVRRQCLQRRQDSLVLAVPTAQVDHQQRQQLLETLESVGLQVLNLVSLFVPVLNAAMLAYTAYDLMSEVYHGIEDWSEDRTDEAMEHLLGVVETIAVGAVLGLAAHKVGRWVNEHGFFQSLRPVQRFDRSLQLWSPELEPYRQRLEVTPAAIDQRGRLLAHGNDHVVIEGHAYRVEQDGAGGSWQIVHPERPQAFKPRLEHNGEGAWRHQWERPWEWPSARYAFRRLGPLAQGMDDADIARVLRWADVDAAQLCQLHMDNAPVPALLRQACVHWRLDRDISGFIAALGTTTVSDNAMAIFLLPHLPGWDPQLTPRIQAAQDSLLLTVLRDALGEQQLEHLGIEAEELDTLAQQKLCELLAVEAQGRRQALFDFCQRRAEPAVQESSLLRRDFPGLPVRMAEELLGQAREDLVARMHRQARVPLAIAQRARGQLSQYRFLCVRQGFEWPWRRDHRFDQLVFGLLEHLPGWPSGLRIELHGQDSAGVLLASAGTNLPGQVRTVVKSAEGHFSIEGQEGSDTDLFTMLNPLLPEGVRQEDGQSLAQALAELADTDRNRARRLSGQVLLEDRFRPPVRLADGRVGYPLSGRGAADEQWQFYRDQAKQLFPRLTDAELTDYLQGLSMASVDVPRLLREKAEELASLRESLSEWVQDRPGPHSSGMQRRRQRVADTLIMAWRRQTPREFGDTGELRGYRLDLEGADLGSPPLFPLGVDFSHVQRLSLKNTGLTAIPNGFLDAFSKLRVLELGRNRLTELPAIIIDMTRLEELRCADNDIQLTERTAGILGNLRRLEVLDLSNNPLGTPPHLTGLTGLRSLNLRFTSIDAFPQGYVELTRLELADLRDNQLSELPETLYQSQSRPARALYLQDNPLSASTTTQIEAYRQQTGINLGGLVESNEIGPELFWTRGDNEALTRQREVKWFSLRKEAGSQEFFRILGELSMTAEYDVARTELFDRVWRMIDAASADSQLRAKLFRLAGHPRTCGNSIALNFSYLEIQVQVFQALAASENSQVTARLLRLGKGLFRLDKLDKVVLDDIRLRRESAQGRWRDVEEVEVSLGYRVRLAEALDLPGQPSAMLFPDLEMISPEQIEAARQAIQAAETPAALAEYLGMQDFWCDWLRQRDTPAFLALRNSLEQQEQALEERRASISDAEYYAGYSSLFQVFQEKTAELIQSLSEEAVGRDLADVASLRHLQG
ncbi:NEL-type E3 ubiquitin ligase domain-containing protein [Pseudomonas wadenswilerensis]|uniref:NEL-type E3 ubiquitin ligase domain-containing protein n=1 Tax=Pseudomonas wadenswilerensis TaxID=1785161 RepID=UPI003208D740